MGAGSRPASASRGTLGPRVPTGWPETRRPGEELGVTRPHSDLDRAEGRPLEEGVEPGQGPGVLMAPVGHGSHHYLLQPLVARSSRSAGALGVFLRSLRPSQDTAAPGRRHAGVGLVWGVGSQPRTCI